MMRAGAVDAAGHPPEAGPTRGEARVPFRLKITDDVPLSSVHENPLDLLDLACKHTAARAVGPKMLHKCGSKG